VSISGIRGQKIPVVWKALGSCRNLSATICEIRGKSVVELDRLVQKHEGRTGRELEKLKAEKLKAEIGPGAAANGRE